MISPKIQDAINAQINAEFWSAYLYLAMGMHFEAEGRTGIANWFRIQFKEEQAHAEIFINYLLSRAAAWCSSLLRMFPNHGLRLWPHLKTPSLTKRR